MDTFKTGFFTGALTRPLLLPPPGGRPGTAPYRVATHPVSDDNFTDYLNHAKHIGAKFGRFFFDAQWQVKRMLFGPTEEAVRAMGFSLETGERIVGVSSVSEVAPVDAKKFHDRRAKNCRLVTFEGNDGSCAFGVTWNEAASFAFSVGAVLLYWNQMQEAMKQCDDIHMPYVDPFGRLNRYREWFADPDLNGIYESVYAEYEAPSYARLMIEPVEDENGRRYEEDFEMSRVSGNLDGFRVAFPVEEEWEYRVEPL